VKIKIKKLHPSAKIPKYATKGDAGLDLTATNYSYNVLHGFHEYGTGLAFEIPEGYVGLLFARSSISKKDLSLCNAVGVLDSGYRGEVSFRFKGKDAYSNNKYSIGDRIGQIIIIPYPQIEFEEVKELNETNRGSGGYGSTGE